MGEMSNEDLRKSVYEQLLQTDEGKALLEGVIKDSEYNDRVLDQAWKIAELNESGANSRAAMSAGASRAGSASSAAASRYSADASTRNAKIQAESSKYGVDVGRLTDQEKIALDRELGYGNLGIESGKLGLQALELPTKYRGAEDYFQQSDLLHGMGQRQDVPLFVQSLLGGGYLPGFQAPGGQPNGFSLQNVINGVLGQGQQVAGAAGGQNASALDAIKGMAAKGLHQLAPGSLERLSPSELGLLKSGVEYSGGGQPAWDFESLLSGYRKAGIGQGDSRAA